jgi:hypothetical protein
MSSPAAPYNVLFAIPGRHGFDSSNEILVNQNKFHFFRNMTNAIHQYGRVNQAVFETASSVGRIDLADNPEPNGRGRAPYQYRAQTVRLPPTSAGLLLVT